MDLKYDNDGEIGVLAEPYPKTNKEMNEWRHRYYDAINDDLGSHDCHGCGYFQAIIWLPKYDDVDNNDDEDDNNESPYFDEDLGAWFMTRFMTTKKNPKITTKLKTKTRMIVTKARGFIFAKNVRNMYLKG